MYKKWERFKRNLESYGVNAGIGGLLEVIGVVDKGSDSLRAELYRGYDYGVFESVSVDEKTYDLRFNPNGNTSETEVEVTVRTHYDDGNEVVCKEVFAIGCYNDMYVRVKRVKNHFTPFGDGYYVAGYAVDSEERYNKEGFQTMVNSEMQRFPRLVYVTRALKEEYGVFVSSCFKGDYRFGVFYDMEVLKERQRYSISGDRFNPYVEDVPDANGLRVMYKENDDNWISFPLFFNEDKTIRYVNFVDNPILQYPNSDPVGYDRDALSFEGAYNC